MASLLRLLLVDDEEAILRSYTTFFVRQGAAVETARSGREALERMRAGSFDVVVSDIAMPEMSGLEFLMNVRSSDPDLPVILMTGDPHLETAVRAVEFGAFQYLGKPIDPQELLRVVRLAARHHQVSHRKRQTLPGGAHANVDDQGALESRFESAMRLAYMAFQPIVSLRLGGVWGYEALLRTEDPVLNAPLDILNAADRLGRLPELGRAARRMVAEAAESADCEGARIFVNIHASDLNDPELYSTTAPLTKIASRVVLEITERASLDCVDDLFGCVGKLKTLGFEIAIDDLGAGYAGLTSFAQLHPQVAKLDMSLVRGMNADARRQSIVRSMKGLCDELDIAVIAEGVETGAERDTLAQLGCDLLQGFFFARPTRGFATVTT
jgi:EAL domain-containing protein (putative c-di-GMP-specific phosphodiesterase class I)